VSRFDFNTASLICAILGIAIGGLLGHCAASARWRRNASDNHHIESGGSLFKVTRL